jgi:hypothetical protein
MWLRRTFCLYRLSCISSATLKLESRFRTPTSLLSLVQCVLCVCCLSSVFCERLFARLEESYRVCVFVCLTVCDLGKSTKSYFHFFFLRIFQFCLNLLFFIFYVFFYFFSEPLNFVLFYVFPKYFLHNFHRLR